MRLILIITLLYTTNLFGQTESDYLLTQEISAIQKTIEKQKQEIEKLNSKFISQQTNISQQRSLISDLKKEVVILNNTVDSLNDLIATNRSSIFSISDDLGVKIQETSQKAETKISELGSDVKKKYRVYWIIATLVILLLGAVMPLFIYKRIKSSKTDVETQIRDAKKSIEEESLKLDKRLIEVLETQLKGQQEESKSQKIATKANDEHSLALKVADEIVRMQKNISKMDADTKGLKPLEKGIQRIQANFAANGYEMTELLNKKFDDRMTIEVVNVLDDENLPKGEKIITRVIRPQVLHNGVLIQRAQVEVSQN